MKVEDAKSAEEKIQFAINSSWTKDKFYKRVSKQYSLLFGSWLAIKS